MTDNKNFKYHSICFLLLALVILIAQGADAITGDNITVINNKNEIMATQFKENISYNKFDLEGFINGGTSSDPFTNIKATKEILPSDKKNSPDIRLTLEMPPKPAKLDIVLAMDTSGSMVQEYKNNTDQTYMDWASGAINKTIAKFPEARVSIVSWDDENEAGDTTTRFYNMPDEKRNVEEILNNLSYECIETDHTIYSIGIKRAVQVMDNKTNWPKDPYNTARIIIFITGLSEFSAEPKNASRGMTLEDQISSARQNRTYEKNTSFNGYQIFPVRIGIGPRYIMEYQNLSKILNGTRIKDQPSVLGDPTSIEDIKNLDDAIEMILNGLRSRPIAYDVRVNDTLYPYLVPAGTENQFKNNSRRPIPAIETWNPPDGSTSFSWNIGNMNGTETWQALIHTHLELSLPIEVSNNKTQVVYGIANMTPASEVNYTWITGYRGSIGFPEGEIRFSRGISSANENYVDPAVKTKLTTKGSSSKENASKKQPGFEALVSAVGLLMAGYLRRRKSW
jgi:hypothetical protein